MVGGHRVLELDLPSFAGHVRERADPPRRARVAVERVRRAIVGSEAHGVAVRGGVDSHHAPLLDDGPRVVARAGEELEPVVGGVVFERLLTGALGVTRRSRAPFPTGAPAAGSCR